MPRCIRFKPRAISPGFTLTELIIAASLGVLVALFAGEAMVAHLRSNARAEALQRQREDWSRSTNFIESEIAMSERVITNAAAVSIDPNCGLNPSEFRMALDIRRDLPLIIYGVRSPRSDEQQLWLPDNLLIRCGPAIGSGAPYPSAIGEDDYLSGNPAASILVDGLDRRASGEGFQVTSSSTNAKSASFTLALKGVRSSYSFGAGTFSRINPVASFPEALSTCDRACDPNGDCNDIAGGYFWKGGWNKTTNSPINDNFSIPTEGLDDNDNTMACGLGGQDSIYGTSANDVIDAGNYPLTSTRGAILDGGSGGRNYLFGTGGDDTFIGGDGDDTLVGRGGGDTMTGKKGTNSYLPWREETTLNRDAIINGGFERDLVFLRGNQSNFGGIPSCSKSSCTLTQAGKTLTMTNVEVLVFKDSRVDLR